MLGSPSAASGGKAGLDFIADQQHVMAFENLGATGEIAARRHDEAGPALQRFSNERRRVRGDGALKRFRIAERHMFEARGKGAEAVAVLLLGGETDDRGGAAGEIAGADDDLGLPGSNAFYFVAPFARRFHGGLDGLGAGVHRQYLVAAEPRGIDDRLQKGAELVGVESARRYRQPRHLLSQRGDDFRVAV